MYQCHLKSVSRCLVFSLLAVVLALSVTVCAFEEYGVSTYASDFPAASDDGTIELTEDVVLASQYTVSDDMTIDGHGFVLSPNDAFGDGALIFHTGSVLTVKNLTIDCRGSISSIISTARFGNVILENVTIINASSERVPLSFSGSSGKTVELNGVTLESEAPLEISGNITANITGDSNIGNISFDPGAAVNIYDGKIGTLAGDGAVKIYGGEFDCELDPSLCAPGTQIVKNDDGSYSVVMQNEFDVSINVSLDGNISVKVNISSTENTFDEALKVTFTGENGEISEYIDSISAESNLVFSLPLAAAQMNDRITIAIETATVKKIRTISVAEYALTLMTDGDLSEETKNLLSAMIDYGTACQYIHGYNTENPANSAWSESYYGSYSEIGSGYTVQNNVNGINLSISLLTKDSTTLRVNINGEDLSDCTFRLDGADVSPIFRSPSSAYIDVPDIAPQALDVMHTISLERDGESARLVCSALTYAEIVMKSQNASAVYKNFAEALYRYYAAAQAYVSP